ncbi:hypothetical protein GCM10009788_29830 [Nocardioides humi]|uniref:Uncharacterized protein n=1 Tax=Nocardioides humi TaxID=449461 RepID=A0ABN2AR08_9ACTN
MLSAHISGDTERIVKYAAKSAAKNMSSLDSQMIVPTATMLGRSCWPCRREAGRDAEAEIATGAIMAVTLPVGIPTPRSGW